MTPVKQMIRQARQSSSLVIPQCRGSLAKNERARVDGEDFRARGN